MNINFSLDFNYSLQVYLYLKYPDKMRYAFFLHCKIVYIAFISLFFFSLHLRFQLRILIFVGGA